MKKLFLSMLFFLLGAMQNYMAQNLSGSVVSQKTGEPIPFATVYIIDLDVASVADDQGYFSFTMSLPDKVKLRVSASGFESQLFEVTMDRIGIKIALTERHIELDEITVSGSKETFNRNSPIHIETRKLSDLNAIPSTTLGEAIANIPGVYQSTTGVGISKPVIRGMQGIRVVTMLNGLRIENQQWSGDHGMGISELGIGNVEVIKGPSSLLYGADALGGVVYFSDESYAKLNTFEVGVKAQFESNTMGTSDQLWFKLSKRNYRFNIAGSFSDHADYQLPNGLYALNTRFKENALKASFSFNQNNWAGHIRYTYNKSRIGIPESSHDPLDHDHDHDLENDNQGREESVPAQAFNNHYLSIENKWFFKKNELSVLLGQTISQLREFEESFSEPAMFMNLSNSLISVRSKTKINPKWTLISGYQGMYQRNKNDLVAEELLIPDAATLDNGVYAIGYFEKNAWSFQMGGRYDQRVLNTKDSFNGIAPVHKTYHGFNFSGGFVRNVSSNTLRFNVSTGFRAPHLSELLANGEHHGSLRYEIGEIELVPEKATQFDLTFEIHRNHLEVIINPFLNYIRDYIALQPLDSLVEDLPVYKYSQYKEVLLYGTDLGVHFHPHFAHWLHLENSISFLQAESTNGENISLIPQTRVSTNLKFSLDLKWKFRPEDIVIQYNYFLRQNRVAVYESASTDYHMVNVGFNWKLDIKNPLIVSMGVKNVFNEQYIDHLSRLKNIGLSHPGRNIYLSLKYTFTKSLRSKA